MLFKLAFRNVKRQMSDYLIYFITVSLTVSILFAVNNLIFSDLMEVLKEQYADFIQPILLCVSGILSIVIAFILSYVTSFLLRRRKKEFGLYLIMGMTRKNILAIFMGETAVTFLFSLGMGLLIGLAVYQGLTAVFINFLEMEYTLGGYSVIATLITVAMVGVMFLISSVASLSYLKFARLSSLLHGDKTFEKTVKYPLVWFCIAVVSLVALIVSGSFIVDFIADPDIDRIVKVLSFVFLFCLSVVMLPVGIAKSVVPTLLKLKKITARGTGTFTLRQLSGRLNANSVMVGVLTLLLTFSFIGPNVFLTMNSTSAAEINQAYVFDVMGRSGGSFSFEEGLQRIAKHAEIDQSCIYTLYKERTGYEESASGIFHPSDEIDENIKVLRNMSPFVKESDFKKMCNMAGHTMPELNGGYLVVVSTWEDRSAYNYDSSFSSEKIELNGTVYSAVGKLTCPYNMFNDYISWTVVPDEAATSEQLSQSDSRLVVTLKNNRFDARALYWELVTVYENGNRGSAYTIKEYERLDSLGQVALFLLGDLFVSVVFILLTMAMLALKMLSMLTEDRERYRTLWRLGADEGMLRKTLFSQMFFFYFLPFALPFAMCFPLAVALKAMVAESAVQISTLVIFGQVAAFAGIILALYALYFTVTYLIARKEVQKTIRAVG